jgi:hypothetical protein
MSTMFNNCLFTQHRPTKRAPDAGALRVARFQAFFYTFSFSQADGVPPPAPARVTQTVGRLPSKIFSFLNHRSKVWKYAVQKTISKPYKQPPPSPIEISFWETAKPLIPELEKEVWIDKKYRVDFLIPSKNVVIELYGYQHHNSKEKITKDAERERYLQKVGYQVIRFTGTEVYKDVRKCVYEVLSLAKIEPAKVQVKPAQPVITPELRQSQTNSVLSSQVAFRQSNLQFADNKIYTSRKKKLFGMETWQVIVLGIMVVIIVCSFLFFVSLLF